MINIQTPITLNPWSLPIIKSNKTTLTSVPIVNWCLMFTAFTVSMRITFYSEISKTGHCTSHSSSGPKTRVPLNSFDFDRNNFHAIEFEWSRILENYIELGGWSTVKRKFTFKLLCWQQTPIYKQWYVLTLSQSISMNTIKLYSLIACFQMQLSLIIDSIFFIIDSQCEVSFNSSRQNIEKWVANKRRHKT